MLLEITIIERILQIHTQKDDDQTTITNTCSVKILIKTLQNNIIKVVFN